MELWEKMLFVCMPIRVEFRALNFLGARSCYGMAHTAGKLMTTQN